MKIRSEITGLSVQGYSREVTWRDTTNYAASIGDANPAYLDDSVSGGIVAPPLFAVAITWPIMEGLQGQLKDAIPPEAVATMVHAYERLIFHRPVRPGDRLGISGEIAAVYPTTAGTMVVLKLTASDAAGREVFTEYGGAMFRGVECDGKAQGLSNLPATFDFKQTGDFLWESTIPISRHAPFVYDGCTNIVFPIHTSVAVAKAVGLPDILLQGTATLAIAAKQILDREAKGDPARLAQIGCRFSGIVIPGSDIRFRLEERMEAPEGVYLKFSVLNHAGKQALSEGFAHIR